MEPIAFFAIFCIVIYVSILHIALNVLMALAYQQTIKSASLVLKIAFHAYFNKMRQFVRQQILDMEY